MIKLSVVIPCYNMSEYIRECINSVLEQTLQEIEIICIDDGSTDNTLGILKEYEAKSKKLIVVQQENQGAGIARNQGICVSRGEYIAFMDADDFYPSPDTLEKMYFTAKRENAEICGGSGCSFRNGTYTYAGFRKGFTFLQDGWIEKEEFPIINGYWRFIYKSDLIKNNQIYFPDYLRCQDPPFFLKAISCAGYVYCMREVTYVYRKEHKQVSFTLKKAIDYAKGMRDSLNISKREGMTAIQQQIKNELQGELSAIMYLYGQKSGEMKEIIHQFNEIIADDDADEAGSRLLKEGDEITAYVKRAREEMLHLLEELKTEKKVLIYGAGTVGKMVRAFFEENNISLEAFVVSDMRQNAESLDGLQIRCIDDYVGKKDECMVIIATFPYLHGEIENTLQERGFEKVYTLSLEKCFLFIGKVVH